MVEMLATKILQLTLKREFFFSYLREKETS